MRFQHGQYRLETKISEVHIYHTYMWKVELWFYTSASYINKIRDSIQGHEPPHSHIHAEAVTCEELLRWKFCESANLHMRARACCLWTWLLWLAICCNKRQVSPFWFFCSSVWETDRHNNTSPWGPIWPASYQHPTWEQDIQQHLHPLNVQIRGALTCTSMLWLDAAGTT